MSKNSMPLKKENIKRTSSKPTKKEIVVRKPAKPAKKAPVARKPAVKVKKEVVMSKPSQPPNLQFSYPKEVYARAIELLDVIDSAYDPTQYVDPLSDLMMELTDIGVDHFFRKPLEAADVGFLVQQSANLGMAGALKIIASVINNVMGRMDRDQILAICRYMRRLMH